MKRATTLPESRLAPLYKGDGFGGEATMRAKVIRELIDEIRALRDELQRIEPDRTGAARSTGSGSSW